jgi:hypothetical protein
MPVKKRRAKGLNFVVTPEILACFQARDERALHRACGLHPCEPSPLNTDLAGPPPYGPAGTSWNLARPKVLAIRREILKAIRGK